MKKFLLLLIILPLLAIAQAPDGDNDPFNSQPPDYKKKKPPPHSASIDSGWLGGLMIAGIVLIVYKRGEKK